MQRFDESWASTTKPVKWEMNDAKQFEIRVTCPHVVQLRGLRGDADPSVLLHSGAGFRTVIDLGGTTFTSLELVQPSGKEFGYGIRPIARQNGEPINHDDPPAAPMPNNSNLLLQIRNMMREEAKARDNHRVFEPEDGMPWADRYQIDEEDWDFEEEIEENRLRELREKEEAANSIDTPPPKPPETPVEDPGKPEVDNHEKIAAE